MTGNADQVAYWNNVSGPKWARDQERLDRLFAPLTAALIAAIAPEPGERVVDIGCGCGDLSLQIAERVGPEGHVTGVDISQPMLAKARTRRTLDSPVAFVEADAAVHPFAPDHDLMVSRFGVMFFADPPAAFLHLRRALRAGGRFGFLCWQARPEVEWMQWPLDRIAAVLPPPLESTGEPGPFGLADAEATLGMLAGAGFADVAVRSVPAMLTLGHGDDPVADAMAVLGETGPAAGCCRQAEPARRDAALALLRQAVADAMRDGCVALGGDCWLYTGTA